MIYNGETNQQDLCTLADKLCKQNSNSFPIKEKTLYANMGSKIIWSWIFEAYGGWHYDDSNNTDLPEGTKTILANTSQITFPVDSAHLMGMAWQDSNGNWNPLKPITLEQIQEQSAEAEFEKTAGRPEFYRPLANGVKIYPATSASIVIKIYISRDISSFLITDTTKTPGFASEYHEAVPVFMALQQSKINSLPQKDDLQNQWDGNEEKTGKEGGYKKAIKSFYGNRFRQLFPPRIRHRDELLDYI